MAMDKQALVAMLNQDFADEHISVIRYLIHAYQVGEDSPLGSMLLAMAREEMWHVDWLGDLLGELGAEPNMVPGVYPHDPTSNASLLRSYIAWEENLIVAYKKQADLVDDPEIKQVLMQQSIESAVHSRRFADMLRKLGPEAEQPLAFGDPGEFSPAMLGRMQSEMGDEYQLVLQHLRDSFAFEDECTASKELELTAMRHMKHLSHFAESLAEAGQNPQFIPPPITPHSTIQAALQTNLELTRAAEARFESLSHDSDLAEHTGLQIEVQQMINQEKFLAERLDEMLEGWPTTPPNPLGQFTVGSLFQDPHKE